MAFTHRWQPTEKKFQSLELSAQKVPIIGTFTSERFTGFLFLPLLVFLFAFTTVAWADDHGNTMQTATPIHSCDIPGTLDTTTDEDWFRLVVQQGGRFFIYSTGDTDTYLRLYDYAGNQIASDDVHGAYYNFNYSAVLNPGTYYLKISSGSSGIRTGAYMLCIRDQANAIPLTPGDLDMSLDVRGQHDFFRIDVKEPGLTFMYTSGSTDTYLLLYNAAGNQITYDDVHGADYNALITSKLSIGVYYVIVRSGSSGPQTGNYGMHYRHPGNAQMIEKKSLSASLDYFGEIDWYRIEIAKYGATFIFSTGDVDTYFNLYDYAGNQITYDDVHGSYYNAQISTVIGVGTYYLSVRSGSSTAKTGSYELHVFQPSEATPLFTDGSRPCGITNFGDKQHFVFSTSGGSAVFESTGSIDTYAFLYNSAGTQIASDDVHGTDYNFKISSSLSAGQYYLIVRGSNVDTDKGTYTLESTFPEAGLTVMSPPARQICATGGVYQLQVQSSESWTATVALAAGGAANWLTVSPTNGSGNRALSVGMGANTSSLAREGVITVGGTRHFVRQLPAPAAWADVPTFSPSGGHVARSSIIVTVRCATAGATIRYTTNGLQPSTYSPALLSGGTAALTLPTSLKAKVWHTNLYASATRTADYVYVEQAAKPAFTPNGGSFMANSIVVTVQCATAGATIRYTTNGVNPTDASAILVSNRVTIAIPCTLKAIALKSGIDPSEITSATYAGSAPSAPLALKASHVETNTFTARWQATATATNYVLDVARDAAFTNCLPGYSNRQVGVQTQLVINLTEPLSWPYFYRVRAQNKHGVSGNSVTTKVPLRKNSPVPWLLLLGLNQEDIETWKKWFAATPTVVAYSFFSASLSHPENNVMGFAGILSGITARGYALHRRPSLMPDAAFELAHLGSNGVRNKTQTDRY